MKLTDLERRVRDHAWPAPSSELRARVLAEATVVAPDITWSDRVWYSRTWRLGVVAAALALVAINQLSTSSAVCCPVGAMQTRAESDALVQASVEIGVPADVAASIARRALTEARPYPILADERRASALFDGPGDQR